MRICGCHIRLWLKQHLTAGESYPVTLLGGGKTAKLYGRPLGNTSVFRSEVGNDISYYFIYGPNIDKVVAGYRSAYGNCAAISQMGVWILAMPRALCESTGNTRCR